MKRFLTTTIAGALLAGFTWAAAPAKDAQASAEVKWYGQAAFRIKTPGGKVILIDPFISKNPRTPAADKDLSRIGKVDLILVTHGHGDHLGDTAALAKQTGAKVALNAERDAAEYAAENASEATELVGDSDKEEVVTHSSQRSKSHLAQPCSVAPLSRDS